MINEKLIKLQYVCVLKYGIVVYVFVLIKFDQIYFYFNVNQFISKEGIMVGFNIFW